MNAYLFIRGQTKPTFVKNIDFIDYVDMNDSNGKVSTKRLVRVVYNKWQSEQTYFQYQILSISILPSDLPCNQKENIDNRMTNVLL